MEQRQIPFGHLFNLCVKHLEARRIEILGQERLFDNIIDMANMFAGLFDVQPYHFVERIHVPPHEFIPFLEECALFDRMFSLPQWRPSDVPRVLRGLFGWVADCQRGRDIAWNVEEAAAFAESVFRLCRNKREPHFLAISALRADLGSIRESAFRELLDIFCHDAATVNADYLRPDRSLEQPQDFIFKPIIRINSGELCLMSSSCCAPAFYEAMAMRLRKMCGSTVDGEIGNRLEVYIRQILTESGITCDYGDYTGQIEYCDGYHRSRVPPGQCDLVVETADTIILFEIKKQPLTRLSRTGDKGQLLYDFARGFIHGHQQLAKQAIILQEQGSLILTNNRGVSEIRLEGKEVERVLVTLDDYGAFQDRVIAKNLLEFMTFVGVSSTDEALKSEMVEMASECSKLRQFLIRLRDESGWPPAGPFFNCRFISLPQLHVILDDAISNESFKQSLWLTRAHSFRTNDFYAEHYYHKKMKEHARQLPDIR
ncbi:MAG: hypothetical protein ACLQPD_18680 [Desulfomonilaceae bacterium]